jgi:hypothetical protein
MSQEFENNSNDEHFVEELTKFVSNEKTVNCEKEKQLNKNIAVRHRRPDMKLYVPPKAKCSNNTVSENDINSVEDNISLQKAVQPIEQTLSELEITNSSLNTCVTYGSNYFDYQNSLTNDMTQTSARDSSLLSKSDDKSDISTHEELDEQNSDIKATNNEITADESSWDSLFDENGDCIRPEFVEKVNSALSLKNSDIKLEKTKINYMNFQYNDPEIDNSEFAHVLEVYDFPIELKTQDIMASLSVFK